MTHRGGNMMKYAIKVCLDGKNDWMYITEPTKHQSDLVPMIFEDKESAEMVDYLLVRVNMYIMQ